MTDDRNKSSGSSHSLPRPTARDVPFTRGADSELEPAPRGKRPGQLPRDPTYEAELAQVELAVLRDPRPAEDPSTKPGRRVPQASTSAPPPASITPESPTVGVAHRSTVPSPEPPASPHGRSVASGTLLSVGAVDPRGKTERTLETPRMFISQQQGSEAYFKPGKIPAVTVHQAIESETVKLSDSIDPRRAKTLPRLKLDRSALQHLADIDGDEEAPASSDAKSSFDPSAPSPHWNQREWDTAADDEEIGSDAGEGQIHASLSPFRDGEQAAPSFSLEGVATRPEPLAARRSDLPPPVASVPEVSTVPTQRDLPAHRIEASRPPPAPAASIKAPVVPPAPALPAIERKSDAVGHPPPADEVPLRRPVWVNYAAFLGALLFAVVLGLWMTGGREAAKPLVTEPASIRTSPPVQAVPAPPEQAAEVAAPAEADSGVAVDDARSLPADASPRPARATTAIAPKPAAAPVVSPARPRSISPANAPAAPPTPPKSNNPKTSRETIF